MRLIEPYATIITERDPFKQIERVGRTCYKSEDKITEDSAKKFYKGLVRREHTAMLEHATFLFEMDKFHYDSLRILNKNNKYLNLTDDFDRYLVSGNLRAINESGAICLCKALYDVDKDLVYNKKMRDYLDTYDVKCMVSVVNFHELEKPTENEFMNHYYMTFLYVTDRGVTHEMVRHRPASYAQESTRYCNYTKNQFGGELTFIKPAHWDSLPDNIKFKYTQIWDACEEAYSRLISLGQTPQQARAILPNSLKTEIIMTACAGELEHFFNLRSRGTTGAPHPDIKKVADMALEIYEINKFMFISK